HLYKQDPFALPEHKDVESTKHWLRSEPENLAFSEVWDDLCEILRTQSQFKSLESGVVFEVRRTSTPEEGLELVNGGTMFVPQTALLDAWQHLRSVGFLSADGLTEGLDLHAERSAVRGTNIVPPLTSSK